MSQSPAGQSGVGDVAVREARRGDVAAIVGLLADDFIGVSREDPGPPLDPRYLEAFDRISGDPHHRLMVAEVDGRVVGTLQITWLSYLSHRGAERALVESVHVAGDQRSRGVGQKLMAWAIAEAKARGCQQMQLTSNLRRGDAHRFYERLGFVASHAGFKLDLQQ